MALSMDDLDQYNVPEVSAAVGMEQTQPDESDAG